MKILNPKLLKTLAFSAVMFAACSEDGERLTDSLPPDPFESNGNAEPVLVVVSEKASKVRHLDSEQIETELDQLIISNIYLNSVDFEVAVAYVMQRASELGPMAPNLIPYSVKGAPPLGSNISIDRGPTQFREALGILCKQANMTWRVEEGSIIFEG